MTAKGEVVSILDIPTTVLTPAMRQYQDAKKANPDCIIMLRMGDFYELFYEDAITASKELDITLTARGKGEKRAPLAGVPYHALEPYLGKLVKKGYKVAIIEQLEDPKQAKGVVKRGLVRIVTPGTVIESSILQEDENNYILSLTTNNETNAIAICDISTGEFFTTTTNSTAELLSYVERFNPQECLIPESLAVNQELIAIIKNTGTFINTLNDYYFKTSAATTLICTHFNLQSIASFGLEDKPLNTAVSGALLQYVIETQQNSLSHIKSISLQSNSQTMLLDASTYRNLELMKRMRDGSSQGTLHNVLNKTTTAMGARLLKKWIKEPLVNIQRIEQRLEAVQELKEKIILREEVKEQLKSIYDIQRLIGRINYGTASPRDLLSLKQSLNIIPHIKEQLSTCNAPLLTQISQLDSLPETKDLIESAIKEDAPITVREGGMIKPEYNEELESLWSIKKNSKQFLAELEAKEKQATGIQSLKIKFNKVFGYFLEVTKKNTSLVPDHYIRKQTTANAERYITEELKIEEEKILNAQEKIAKIEYDIFQTILQQVAQKTSQIQETATKIAVLDCLLSFAVVSAQNGYNRPRFSESPEISISAGRHPVIEQTTNRFIANDVFLDPGEMMIITGPNMAGKSTVMRQTALIILMAQMGCFIPAQSATLQITDRIFTRVGASDDLGAGQSTFMVEMSETASILNNATKNSFIILDEIGRGTSTFDGVSLAWSVAEHIYNHIGAKTMFATHYHVMNKLSEKFANIKNYNIAVKESAGDITFLRKLVPGGTDQSYGIHVAKLAGLPNSVLDRAKEIQQLLQQEDEMVSKIKAKKLKKQTCLENFSQ